MALSYKEAGVDKEQGYKEVGLIKKFIKETYTPGVLSDLGGFSGLFSLEEEKLSHPVLVSGTDGVGTKVVLAQKLDRHKTIGIDCVAGSKTLIFLRLYCLRKTSCREDGRDCGRGCGRL